tara:strand:+ start:447 stop:698 length:252 start_codon:yes stop_codon:yes gene_type:complete
MEMEKNTTTIQANSQWFNHILSMFATSELSEDELQVFVQTLLDHLREALKNTDDWFFQNHLFKEVTDKLKKDQYWIKKLNGER